MALSPRLLRPIAGGAGSGHPEALAWRNRVLANGGSVSGATLAAVSTFCASIDAESGLRAAILRCNLFCGQSDASLNAVRTPLYLSGSLGGTAIGNTTDTNINFAQGDYQETGSGGGLVGNGTSKYLDTGFSPSLWSNRSSVHMSCSGTSLEATGDRTALGVFGTTNAEGQIYSLDIYAAYVSARAVRLSSYSIVSQSNLNFPALLSPSSSEPHFIGTRTASNDSRMFRSGSQTSASTYSTSPADTSRPIFVFALNDRGTAGSYTAARLRMYSIGNGLTAAQALAFSNAVIAFNTTLGRA